MPVRSTSIRAYHEHVQLGAQQKAILDAFRRHGCMNGRMIKDKTGIEINAVCGRIDELRKKGLIREVGKGTDMLTGRKTIFYTFSEQEKQMEMFS